MANSITFLCQHCLMPVNGKHLRVNPNPLSDIAFAMPDSIFEPIRSTLAGIDPAAARKIREDGRFRCITLEEAFGNTAIDVSSDEHIRGTLTLDWDWLKTRLLRLGISPDSKIAMQHGTVYEAIHEFWFNRATDGTQIPWLIKDGDCKEIGRELRCRNCGRFLPVDTGKAIELRILLQGNSRAGKTSVIVSTFWWLLMMSANGGSGISYELSRERDAVSDGIAANMNEYHRWLKTELNRFCNGHKVEKTPSQQDEPGSVSALVTIGGQPLVLTFLDMPGEFFEGTQEGEWLLLKQYTNIYRNVDAIWTCLQYEVLVDKDWSDQKATIMDKTGVTLQNLELDRDAYRARLNELFRYLSVKQKYSTADAADASQTSLKEKPHAVILTKTDSLEGRIFGLEENFIFESKNEGKSNLLDGFGVSSPDRRGHQYPMLNEEEFYKITSRVYQFCRRNAGNDPQNMLTMLERMTDNVCFFAHSAYGHPALKKDDTGVKAPKPYHVQLPLLWTLAACDKLRIFYEVRVQDNWFSHHMAREMHFLSDADWVCANHLLKIPHVYTPHVRR